MVQLLHQTQLLGSSVTDIKGGAGFGYGGGDSGTARARRRRDSVWDYDD